MSGTSPVKEPAPPDPTWPRYATRDFPAYRYLPGHSPHPVRDPDGHSFGRRARPSEPLDVQRWYDCETYLHAIDLYNFAYWWECHEELEGLWNEVGRQTQAGLVLRGLIQIAAANLKQHLGSTAAARSLSRKGLGALSGVRGVYLGIDMPRFGADALAFFGGRRRLPALIRLSV